MCDGIIKIYIRRNRGECCDGELGGKQAVSTIQEDQNKRVEDENETAEVDRGGVVD